MPTDRHNDRTDFEDVNARLERLESRLAFADQYGAQPPIFLARAGDTDLQWQEQLVVTIAGAPTILDFIDGRVCTGDTDTCALIDRGQTDVYMEILEGNAARYVRITPGVGQYKYMIYQMVAMRVAGWNFGLAHPPQV